MADNTNGFITLVDALRFQRRVDEALSSDSFSAFKLKDDDDKYYANLLPFWESTDEDPRDLFLWVLHFVDKIRISVHPDPFAACCEYFPCSVTSAIADPFLEAYNGLPPGTNLDEACFQGLIAAVFAPLVLVSEVSAFRTFLLSGPRKPSDMTVDSHLQSLRKFSNLSSDAAIVPLTEDEIKQAFYQGSHTTWRTEFQQANPLVPDIVNHFDTAALLQAMRGYQRASKQKALQREQQQNRSQSRQDRSRPRDSNNSGNRDRRVRSRQSRGGLRGGNRDSSRGGNRRGGSDRTDSSGDTRGASDGNNNSDPCPYRTTMDSHRNHSWADCIYNPTGRNFNQSLFDVMVQRSKLQTFYRWQCRKQSPSRWFQ